MPDIVDETGARRAIHSHAAQAADRLGFALPTAEDWQLLAALPALERFVDLYGVEWVHSRLLLIAARQGVGLPCVRRTT